MGIYLTLKIDLTFLCAISVDITWIIIGEIISNLKKELNKLLIVKHKTSISE